MNEKLVQEVIEIEKAAQQTFDAAVREAEQLPRDAQQEAEAMIEKALREAQDEARRLVQKAQSEDASARILQEAEQTMSDAKGLSRTHLERAVNFVVNQVAGR
jgi:vacuolar-type H+-ATPase subunit H